MNRGGRSTHGRGGHNNRYSSRGDGRGGNSRGAPRSTSPKGVFADGIWHCDCMPRLPAERFKVKKESKNKGRWFYTCQNQEPQRCGFFLWDEGAKLREEGVVLNNITSEPKNKQVLATQDGWAAGRSRRGIFANISPMRTNPHNQATGEDGESTEDEDTPPKHSPQLHNSSVKRKADTEILYGDGEDDELLPWPLNSDEEGDLIRAADSVAPPPETPRKARKTGVYATPATTIDRKRTLPWLQQPRDESITPTTPVPLNSHLIDRTESPSKRPTKCIVPIQEQAYPPTPTLQAHMPDTQSKSPSPHGRYRDALSNPDDGVSSLTSEALATLSDTYISPAILTTLRGILSKHELKAQGVVKGREISRLALKAKDAKIVELQAKIASLEAEREVDRGVIRSLKWESAHGVYGAVDEE